MSTAPVSPADPARLVEITEDSTNKPRSVDRLRDWEYLERQMHRLICAWGRFFGDWEDIISVHRQVWEQAECVRRLRERLTQFPGGKKNLDTPVSKELEELVEHVLLAPTHSDAIEGIYGLLNRALMSSYAHYVAGANPIHDAPTLELINEIMTIKEGFRLWLHGLRRKFGAYEGNAEYLDGFTKKLEAVGQLNLPLTPTEPAAGPVGIGTKFRQPLHAARPANSEPKEDFRPFMFADFQTDIEARRLFWAWAYANELNLSMNQLRWIYDSPYMPWDFHHDLSRHLWDESRHGDSGRSRMLDFDIHHDEIGFYSYSGDTEPWENREPLYPQLGQDQDGALPACVAAEPMTPNELYDEVFNIGMIAENGHFQVKREAYEDFKAGGDMESAEMMLFDIVDEHSHVQYAHKWLPMLAKHAERDNSDYLQRAQQIRKEAGQTALDNAAKHAETPRHDDDPAYQLYLRLREKMQAVRPLSNTDDREPRTNLPM